MSAPIFITAPSSQPQRRNPLLAILGLALTLPAVAAWLYSLVAPTWRTWQLSSHSGTLLRPGGAVGLANYRQVLNDAAFRQALRFTLSLTLERTLIVALAPLILALLVNVFGRAVRIPLRLLFTIPLAAFSPVATALLWRLAFDPQFGLLRGDRNVLAGPAQAGAALRRVDMLATAVLACGAGLTIYLLALRGAGSGVPRAGRVIPALLVTWLITIFATIALTLQTFTLSYVLTNGGPARRTSTVALYQFQSAFQQLQSGIAGAVGGLLLLVAGVLGLVSIALIAGSGLRLELTPAEKPVGINGRGGQPLVAIVLMLAVLAGVALLAFWAYPILWAALTALKSRADAVNPASAFFPGHPTTDAYDRLRQALPRDLLWRNTLLPALVAVLGIQLPISYLAAFGIGALRPLGRFSEWLLLPFSPWFFVTTVPLSVALFARYQDYGWLNRLVAVAPPLLLNVPMLVVLTVGFKGFTTRWQAARATGRLARTNFFVAVVLPSLPLAVIVAAVTLLLDTQELFWPLVTASDRRYWTIPVALNGLAQQFATDPALIAAAATYFGLLFFAVFFLIFGLLQIFYFDRLALVVGSGD
jgi:ABC-type sugar transport system permease subunit